MAEEEKGGEGKYYHKYRINNLNICHKVLITKIPICWEKLVGVLFLEISSIIHNRPWSFKCKSILGLTVFDTLLNFLSIP